MVNKVTFVGFRGGAITPIASPGSAPGSNSSICLRDWTGTYYCTEQSVSVQIVQPSLRVCVKLTRLDKPTVKRIMLVNCQI